MSAAADTPGLIELLEDSVHLVRRAPLATLLCHWTGSVPFAVALLFVWQSLPDATDATLALDALLLALLLAWMHAWRAVYAGRLRRALSGADDAPWTPRRIWRLAATQSFLGAIKLPALAGSLFVLFPFATTIAAFRYTAVLADRDMDSPREYFARARALATVERYQSWVLLPVLLLFSLVLLINVTLTLVILPQLVHILTGWESSFSRGGEYFFRNWTFLAIDVALCWLLFDPFVQAVYCVRAFQAESRQTGEDVRAELRACRAAAAARYAALPLVLFFLVVPHLAARIIAPSRLDQSVRQAVEAPSYAWHRPVPAAAARDANMPWIVRMANRIIDALNRAMEWVFDTIGSIVRWILRQFEFQGGHAGDGAPPGRGFHWTVYALMALTAASAVWLLWNRSRARRRPPAVAVAVKMVRLEDEQLTADRLPEAEWLALAEECLRTGDRRGALRANYLALLAWLGQAGWLSIHPGKTNREFQRELAHKAGAASAVRDLFAVNVRSYESVWYGLHGLSAEDIDEFRERVAELKSLLATREAAA